MGIWMEFSEIRLIVDAECSTHVRSCFASAGDSQLAMIFHVPAARALMSPPPLPHPRRGIGKMFASAGDSQLAMIFHVPAALAEKLPLKEWVDAVSAAISGEVVEIGAEVAKVKVAADPVGSVEGLRGLMRH